VTALERWALEHRVAIQEARQRYDAAQHRKKKRSDGSSTAKRMGPVRDV
jgi:hypothetical protein